MQLQNFPPPTLEWGCRKADLSARWRPRALNCRHRHLEMTTSTFGPHPDGYYVIVCRLIPTLPRFAKRLAKNWMFLFERNLEYGTGCWIFYRVYARQPSIGCRSLVRVAFFPHLFCTSSTIALPVIPRSVQSKAPLSGHLQGWFHRKISLMLACSASPSLFWQNPGLP